MPFDFVLTSPPFARKSATKFWWQMMSAPLLAATRDSHVVVWHGALLMLVPRRLLAILAGKAEAPGSDEPYPEAFVIGSGADYAKVTHELEADGTVTALSDAFARLRVTDWSAWIVDPDALLYRCFEGVAAEKLMRCFIEAINGSCVQVECVEPIKPVLSNRNDGGQDGLLRVGDRHFWLQITGGRKPDILPFAKQPLQVARYFFHPEGDSQQVKTKAAKLRRALHGDRTPFRAHVLHLAVGKSAPLALTSRRARGAVRERVTESAAPQWLWTITLHALMVRTPPFSPRPPASSDPGSFAG